MRFLSKAGEVAFARQSGLILLRKLVSMMVNIVLPIVLRYNSREEICTQNIGNLKCEARSDNRWWTSTARFFKNTRSPRSD